MTRVYNPFTGADLDALDGAGACPRLAFAVTDAVRALVADGDEELYEHIATQCAAASALDADRVVVAALDVAPSRISEEPEGALGQVRLDAPITALDVVCYLVGDEGERVSEDADLELSWYDATERQLVRDLL